MPSFLEIHRAADNPLYEFDNPFHEVLHFGRVLDRQIADGQSSNDEYDDYTDEKREYDG